MINHDVSFLDQSLEHLHDPSGSEGERISSLISVLFNDEPSTSFVASMAKRTASAPIA